jgi:hypothetical protein
MDARETQLLESFLNQLVQARAEGKDPQADALIRAAVARQPDAAYLLVQKAMLLGRALDAAKARIGELEAQLQNAPGAAGAPGFLDGASSWGTHAGTRAAPTAPAAPPATAPAAAPQTGRSGFFGDSMRSTVGSIASTAAGVAAGAFLFEGVEHLLHRGSGGFFGSPLASGFATQPTVVNNFFEEGPLAVNDDGRSGGFMDDSALLDDMDDDPTII